MKAKESQCSHHSIHFIAHQSFSIMGTVTVVWGWEIKILSGARVMGLECNVFFWIISDQFVARSVAADVACVCFVQWLTTLTTCHG